MNEDQKILVKIWGQLKDIDYCDLSKAEKKILTLVAQSSAGQYVELTKERND
jgi:hypothetical protein